MARAVLVLIAVLLVLTLARALRLFVAGLLKGSTPSRRPPAREGEMAKDPVCGVWFDRRLAVSGRRDGERVEVCSEGCRRRLEAG